MCFFICASAIRSVLNSLSVIKAAVISGRSMKLTIICKTPEATKQTVAAEDPTNKFQGD